VSESAGKNVRYAPPNSNMTIKIPTIKELNNNQKLRVKMLLIFYKD